KKYFFLKKNFQKSEMGGMLFKFFYVDFFNASFWATKNTSAVAFANIKQKRNSVRSKSWNDKRSKDRTERRTITQPLSQPSKNSIVIFCQARGSCCQAQDWTIGKILTERRYLSPRRKLYEHEKLSYVALDNDELKKADTSSELENKTTNYLVAKLSLLVLKDSDAQKLETSITKGSHKKRGYVLKKREIANEFIINFFFKIIELFQIIKIFPNWNGMTTGNNIKSTIIDTKSILFKHDIMTINRCEHLQICFNEDK
ncbi:hypothetical protein RFI_05217, partial [Reticulomyxa filosa]